MRERSNSDDKTTTRHDQTPAKARSSKPRPTPGSRPSQSPPLAVSVSWYILPFNIHTQNRRPPKWRFATLTFSRRETQARSRDSSHPTPSLKLTCPHATGTIARHGPGYAVLFQSEDRSVRLAPDAEAIHRSLIMHVHRCSNFVYDTICSLTLIPI